MNGFVGLLLACVPGVIFAGFGERDFVVEARDVAPEVSYAVNEGEVEVRTKNPWGGAVEGRLAVGRSKMVVKELTKFPAVVRFGGEDLGEGELRLGLELKWMRADGSVRDQRVYWTPPEAGALPKEVSRLAVFDRTGYREAISDATEGISVPLKMGEAGFATVVIEDEAGNRVRNLVSSQPYKKGTARVEWDGRNEWGQPVAPGKYRYRGVQHPGIRHEFQFQFANGDEAFATPWGSNHAVMSDVASNSNFVFAASHITEGGYMLVQLTPEGKWVKGFPQPHPWGGPYVRIAADEEKLYFAIQGSGLTKAPSKHQHIAITIYDIEKGGYVPVNRDHIHYVFTAKDGPEGHEAFSALPEEKKEMLKALAIHKGSLYVANAWTGTVMELCPTNLALTATIALPKVEDLCSAGGVLYAASGKDVLALDEGAKIFKRVFSVPFEIAAFSVRGDEVAVLGDPDSTVKLYTLKGKKVGQVGEPGGAYAGAWREKRLVNPMDVEMAQDGSVWTTEYRRQPKRIVRWNRKGDVLYTKYGCPAYGSPSCGFDPEEASRFYAEGLEWKLDFAKKSAEPVAVLWKDGLLKELGAPMQMQVARYEGRTYFVMMYTAMHVIAERMKDGTAKPMVLLSSPQRLGELKKNPMVAKYLEARNPPERLKKSPQWGTWDNWSAVFFWLDKNANGAMEEAEFSVYPVDFFHAMWGMRTMGLEMNVGVREGTQDSFLCLKPEGLLPNGVLNYDIEKAMANRVKPNFDYPMGLRTIGPSEDTVDGKGNMIFDTAPWMVCVSPEGKLNWFYENRYPDVHGSQKAPLPARGLYQGGLFSLGVVPFDEEGEIFAVLGNGGQLFLFTTDGLFVDQIFEDHRIYSVHDFNNLADEAFGGTFQYVRPTKEYMLQAGKGGYRIYKIRNIEKIRRFEGELEVTYEMLEAAQRRNPLKVEKAKEVAKLEIPCVEKVTSVGAKQNMKMLCFWDHGALRNSVKGCYDSENLLLEWGVSDLSPWLNKGKDWTMMFKTGDSVDLQLCVDSARTKETRKDAAKGDLRLLIAPFEGEPMAVLYRYRVEKKAGEALNTIEFACPWRTYRVDDVKRVVGVKVSTRILEGNGYTVTAEIPLATLGVTAAELEGGVFRGDVGVVYSDREGEANLARSYWSNKETGLVSDVPGEIMPPVENWGEITFGKRAE